MNYKIYSLPICLLTTLLIWGCSHPYCHDEPTPVPMVVNPQNFTDISKITFPNLFCTSFIDSIHGYISGSAGFISRTTNGGITWTDVSVASTQDMYGVYFINENEGYAAGNNGDLFKTINAGTSWTKLTTPNSSNNYAQIHFFDALNGIAGGGTPSRAGTLIKTTDGGSTWNDIPVTGMSSIYDIEFIDNTTGYLCGYDNNIFKTTDGGATWVNQPVTITTPAINTILLAEIEFVSTTFGYCVGFSISFDKNYIFKTTDAGATWNQLTSPAQTSSTADVYASFFAVSANEIYIVGGNVANNTSTLLKSTNGGISWSNVALNTNRLSGSIFIQNTSYAVGLNGAIVKSRTY
jgi:photosystem II stability/assembly factor-like uncharacterized protein